jgi:hypothetical protein
MDEEQLAKLLEEYDDEALETLMAFVESLGSFEEARAAIDALETPDLLSVFPPDGQSDLTLAWRRAKRCDAAEIRGRIATRFQ